MKMFVLSDLFCYYHNCQCFILQIIKFKIARLAWMVCEIDTRIYTSSSGMSLRLVHRYLCYLCGFAVGREGGSSQVSVCVVGISITHVGRPSYPFYIDFIDKGKGFKYTRGGERERIPRPRHLPPL